MKLHEILVEKVLPYDISGDAATFEYGNGRTMIMKMTSGKNKPGSFEVSFYPADKEGVDQYAADDAGGSELDIFYTVMDFVENWYSSNKDRAKMIYAEPSINDKYTGKRHRLYTTLFKRMAKHLGGSVTSNGQFIYWYPDAAETKELRNIISAISTLIADAGMWETALEEGYGEYDINGISLTINEANLQGGVCAIAADDTYIYSDDVQIGIEVDPDAYYELAESGKLEDRLRQDLSMMIDVVNSLL